MGIRSCIAITVTTFSPVLCTVAKGSPPQIIASALEPQWLTVSGRHVYFSGRDDFNGRELWLTDGTVVGTRLVADVYPGEASSQPRQLLAKGGRVWFIGNRGPSGPYAGEEVWTTDGTASGTLSVVSTVSMSAPVGRPLGLELVGTNLCWYSENSLWCYSEVTGQSALIGTFSGITQLVGIGSDLYFFDHALGSTDTTLWTFDLGTQVLAMIATFTGSSSVPAIADEAVAVGTRLFFRLKGSELWVSDGTETGTIQLLTGTTIPERGPRLLTPFDTKLAFTFDDIVHGREVWISDGTNEGTQLLVDLVSGFLDSGPDWLTVVEDYLYLSGKSPLFGGVIWAVQQNTYLFTVQSTDFLSSPLPISESHGGAM